ncbi:methionine adenosyltransferase domain-containing protein [Geochorda subterranea]|uniref:methionine adenosyltransferase domain-containing protein n=1 Tax=Geochorda subterranea TaxID=3109564 RepID=UPI003860133E
MVGPCDHVVHEGQSWHRTSGVVPALRQRIHSCRPGFREAEAGVAYAIGVPRAVSVRVETSGTEVIPDDVIADVVERFLDLRPGAVIQRLDLQQPIYRRLAAYGHFGQTDLDLLSGRTDVALLRAASLGQDGAGAVVGAGGPGGRAHDPGSTQRGRPRGVAREVSRGLDHPGVVNSRLAGTSFLHLLPRSS